MEHTHEECCDVHLTLGVCSSKVDTVAWEYMLQYLGEHQPDANVF